MNELMERLASAFGPSGRETAVRELIAAELAPFVRETRVDAMGNLIAHIPGEGSRLLLCAHCDTVGFVVTYIEDNGLLRVGTLGTLTAEQLRLLASLPVVFENGVRGMVHLDADAGEKPTASKLYIEIDADSAEAAKQRVAVGDTAVPALPAYEFGTKAHAPGLGGRAACWALLEVVRRIRAPKHDLWIAFTVQEELGHRGAAPAAFGADAAYAVVIGTANASDVPGAEKGAGVKLGAGAGVKVLDRTVICNPQLVAAMNRAAQAQQIPVQQVVARTETSEGGAVAGVRSGVRTGGVCIPTRHLHTPMEEIDTRDAEAAAALLAALAETEWTA